tara:strand:+ start:19 stop:423 length:405 start_codon:yes stop_codon:yes gene_type:complete
LKLTILSPRGKLLESDTDSLIMPFERGYIGVKDNHQSMTGLIVPGTLWLKRNNKEETRFVSNGFAEIKNNEVLLLTDASEIKSEINKKRAEDSLSRAKARLLEKDVNKKRAEDSLSRAKARLNVVQGDFLNVSK